MPFIIYPQPNGQVAVIIPTGDVSDCIKDVPPNTEYAIVESLENVDNDYFNGFIYADGEAVAEIAKCKNIHLDKFRAARAPMLAALDIDYSRADESGDAPKKAEIATKKQALRDVTKVELPSDLPSLKEFWPSILGPSP